ncbi:MAG: hypothetical protein ACXAEN_19475 [Candidatus Thorarchaeota archaeon]|jgi:hypothetical protein
MEEGVSVPEEEKDTLSDCIVAVGVSVSLIVATYSIFILGHNGGLTVVYGLLMALAGGWLRGKGKEFKEGIARLRGRY